MLPIIKRNATRLTELHDKIHETVKYRSESPEALKAWQEACKQFRDQYDALAFPGGLTSSLEKIKAEDLQTIEIALNYLEDSPYCFRSQYVATDLKRAINKVSLPEPLASRFAEWKNKKKTRISHPS